MTRVTVLELQSAQVQRDSRTLLGPIDLQIAPGQRWAVLGPNGSGKTTMLQLAAALVRPSAGCVKLLGQQVGKVDMRILRRRVSLSSAAIRSQLPPQLTAAEIVLTGSDSSLAPWWSSYSSQQRRTAHELLAQGGLQNKANQIWSTLSEGERQQVLLSRALICEPELLLLDEPFAALDLGSRERLLVRLEQLALSRPNLPLIMVTHHVEEIPTSFTHGLLMKSGQIVSSGEIGSVLTASNLSSCFNLSLDVQFDAGRWRAVALPSDGTVGALPK